jgi:hypothetical protein
MMCIGISSAHGLYVTRHEHVRRFTTCVINNEGHTSAVQDSVSACNPGALNKPGICVVSRTTKSTTSMQSALPFTAAPGPPLQRRGPPFRVILFCGNMQIRRFLLGALTCVGGGCRGV